MHSSSVPFLGEENKAEVSTGVVRKLKQTHLHQRPQREERGEQVDAEHHLVRGHLVRLEQLVLEVGRDTARRGPPSAP